MPSNIHSVTQISFFFERDLIRRLQDDLHESSSSESLKKRQNLKETLAKKDSVLGNYPGPWSKRHAMA